jgi:hypothetical protein
VAARYHAGANLGELAIGFARSEAAVGQLLDAASVGWRLRHGGTDRTTRFDLTHVSLYRQKVIADMCRTGPAHEVAKAYGNPDPRRRAHRSP